MYVDHTDNLSVVAGIALQDEDTIFGLIDDSDDEICTPFAHPDGNYIGAPRQPE